MDTVSLAAKALLIGHMVGIGMRSPCLFKPVSFGLFTRAELERETRACTLYLVVESERVHSMALNTG